MKGTGLRYNEGKLRYDLIHPKALKGLVSVLTRGASKYTIKWEDEWEKIFSVPNAIELRLTIAGICVVAVTRNGSETVILNMPKGKERTVENGAINMLQEKENWTGLGGSILSLEKEMPKQNGEYISGNLISQKISTKNSAKKDARYVEQKSTCTLTMTIPVGNSEEYFAVSATTVSECLETMKKELGERLGICWENYDVKRKGERNWENGMKWSNVIASLKRHLAAIEAGEDYDKETGALHADHLQCNAHFLSAYYSIFPQGDDRPNTYFNKRVALDIDGVLADFNKSVKSKFGIENDPTHWYYSYTFDKALWEELKADKDFWLNIEPYFDGSFIPFEPVCYVTHRSVPKEWCEEWLEKNHFPCVPVHVVGSSKVDKLKELDIDIFVDDKYDNFKELNDNGIFTYLLTQPWNERYNVGHKRIDSLVEIIER